MPPEVSYVWNFPTSFAGAQGVFAHSVYSYSYVCGDSMQLKYT